MTRADNDSAKATFELPTITFPAKELQCTHCHSYQWKRADIYHEIEINEAESVAAPLRSMLETAIKYNEGQESHGILARLGNKLFGVSVETAEASLALAEKRKAEKIANRDAATVTLGPLKKARVCVSCKLPYIVANE
jgi:hypothetical protein